MDGLPVNRDLSLVEVGEIEATRPWGFWGTVGWSLLILFAWGGIQVGVAGFFLLGRWANKPPIDPDQIGSNGTVFGVGLLLGLPVMAGVPWWLARVRCPPAGDYLAYRPSRFSRTALAMFGLAILRVAQDGLSLAIGRPMVPELMARIYQSPPHSMVLAAILIVEPLAEEIFFRGFLYRGLAGSRLGPGMAIGLTSVAFAMVHRSPYDLYGVALVYLFGLYLGTVRYLTGSVRLTILLHTLMNLITTAELALLG